MERWAAFLVLALADSAALVVFVALLVLVALMARRVLVLPLPLPLLAQALFRLPPRRFFRRRVRGRRSRRAGMAFRRR